MEKSLTRKNGIALVEKIMKSTSGRAGISINGERVGCNKSRSRIFAGDKSMPAEKLIGSLTAHEFFELENLPAWDGGNEYQINSKALRYVNAAIHRFEFKAFPQRYQCTCQSEEEHVKKGLELCCCNQEECSKARENHFGRG